MNELLNKRPVKTDDEMALFDLAPDWKKDWWGMPSYSMGDAMAEYQITMNFMTLADLVEFAQVTGLKVTGQSKSAWFPQQEKLKGELCWYGPKTDSRYPVCIPSKGRAKIQTTGKILTRLGVSHKFFVEEHEYEDYVAELGADRVVKMPFSNLGLGSTPARNFIWEWAKERGHKRHWTVDDNILAFVRCTNNRRLIVKGGGFFRAMEDFVDRYENIDMAGPHGQGSVPDRNGRITPFLLNSRVYSCILLNTDLPHRWRGKYNEDTDLSLRLLKEGRCTLLFRALLMSKAITAGAKGKAKAGGNTDNVYNTGDHRLAFAQSLADQHPDRVKVVWKFNRWHHSVDYSGFKQRPVLKAGIVPRKDDNDYGMRLTRQVRTPSGQFVVQGEAEDLAELDLQSESVLESFESDRSKEEDAHGPEPENDEPCDSFESIAANL